MKYEEIKNLLDKYFAGETSLEEENLLKEYFSKPNVHADFEAYTSLFNYFSENKLIQTNKDFDETILSKIKDKKPTKSIKLFWMKVAAVVLIMIGAASIIYKINYQNNKTETIQTVAENKVQNNNNQIEISDTYSNPEDAKKAVEHALALLSRKMNKGKNMAEKNIAKMDVLNKAIDN